MLQVRIFWKEGQLTSGTGSNIYINPDLTKQEREDGKRLRSQLAERRAKGERNPIIRRAKIIKLVQVTDGSDSVAMLDCHYFH